MTGINYERKGTNMPRRKLAPVGAARLRKIVTNNFALPVLTILEDFKPQSLLKPSDHLGIA